MRKLIYLWLMVVLPICLLAHQAAIKGKATNNSNGTTSTSDAAFSIKAPAAASEITYTIILQKPNYI